MKVKIIANNSIIDKEYYDKFIGKTFDAIYYEKIYGVCELLIPSPQGDKVTYWYDDEYEIVEQDEYMEITKKEYDELLDIKWRYENLQD